MAQEGLRARAAAAGSSTTGSRTSDIPQAGSSAPAQASEPQRNDYELVLGRGQIASCLFAGTVVLAIFAGGAYFAGKLSTLNCVAASNSIQQATAPLRVASVVPPASGAGSDAPSATQVSLPSAANQSGAIPFMVGSPAGVAESKNGMNALAPVAMGIRGPAALDAQANSTAHEPRTAQTNADAKNSPLFASPQRGALYLQVGAVDKGMATIIAEGLRQHGLTSFVAPGPSDKIFRVLVGPFADQDEYRRAKTEADSIDVGSFARQFEK